MATRPLNESDRFDTLKKLQKHGYPSTPLYAAAKLAKIDGSTARRHIKWLGSLTEPQPKAAQFTVAELPDTDIPVGDLVAHRKKQFAQLDIAKKARALIPVQIKIDGPIAISHFGDPHVDDDGTDIGLLEEHALIIRRTEGMFAANIGDTTNNWVGRLARLYGEQSTSAKQAWQLCEWFLNSAEWLYVITGNHDAWSGAGDPLKYILRNGAGVKGGATARLNLAFPNGREVRINARHNFPGHSMYNTAHGMAKAAMNGWRDHVLIAGHTHTSGYNILKDPANGTLSHCIRVASYKIHDRYADDLGLDDKAISPNVVTVINPDARSEAQLIHVLHDVQDGADYLTWLRGRK